MPKDLAARYFLEEFEQDDRLAVVLVNKHSESVIQRISSANGLASAESLEWMRYQNRMGYEVYCSPNALHEDARGRTKDDIETIRHVFLDFDEDGTAAIERIRQAPGMPQPNYLISSSPDRWQAFWRAEGFSKDQAEQLQRGLASEHGADAAATDASRVMRVPGFYNNKYPRRHYVRIERVHSESHRPDQFPNLNAEHRGKLEASSQPGGVRSTGGLSQSERDWAYAKRALSRGESAEVVTAAIARFRRGAKHDVQYYAQLTVRKAADALNLRAQGDSPGPDR